MVGLVDDRDRVPGLLDVEDPLGAVDGACLAADLVGLEQRGGLLVVQDRVDQDGFAGLDLVTDLQVAVAGRVGGDVAGLRRDEAELVDEQDRVGLTEQVDDRVPVDGAGQVRAAHGVGGAAVEEPAVAVVVAGDAGAVEGVDDEPRGAHHRGLRGVDDRRAVDLHQRGRVGVATTAGAARVAVRLEVGVVVAGVDLGAVSLHVGGRRQRHERAVAVVDDRGRVRVGAEGTGVGARAVDGVHAEARAAPAQRHGYVVYDGAGRVDPVRGADRGREVGGLAGDRAADRHAGLGRAHPVRPDVDALTPAAVAAVVIVGLGVGAEAGAVGATVEPGVEGGTGLDEHGPDGLEARAVEHAGVVGDRKVGIGVSTREQAAASLRRVDTQALRGRGGERHVPAGRHRRAGPEAGRGVVGRREGRAGRADRDDAAALGGGGRGAGHEGQRAHGDVQAAQSCAGRDAGAVRVGAVAGSTDGRPCHRADYDLRLGVLDVDRSPADTGRRRRDDAVARMADQARGSTDTDQVVGPAEANVRQREREGLGARAGGNGDALVHEVVHPAGRARRGHGVAGRVSQCERRAGDVGDVGTAVNEAADRVLAEDGQRVRRTQGGGGEVRGQREDDDGDRGVVGGRRSAVGVGAIGRVGDATDGVAVAVGELDLVGAVVDQV